MLHFYCSSFSSIQIVTGPPFPSWFFSTGPARVKLLYKKLYETADVYIIGAFYDFMIKNHKYDRSKERPKHFSQLKKYTKKKKLANWCTDKLHDSSFHIIIGYLEGGIYLETGTGSPPPLVSLLSWCVGYLEGVVLEDRNRKSFSNQPTDLVLGLPGGRGT